MNLRQTFSSTEGAAENMNGAEAMVRMLQGFGVSHIFGLCGDTSLPFYDALHRLDHGMKHILCRDERSAGYMADGYARVSGKVGVCEGPSGGGATYILPGLVEANESSVPVLGITTDVAVSSRGRFTLTELDQQALFRPLTKWNTVLDRSVDIPRVMRQAFTQMTTGRPGAAHIGLPYDVQVGPVEADDVWADRTFGQYPANRVGPDPDDVERAGKMLRDASSPVVVVGGGVIISQAERELISLAERLSIPISTTISGQGSIPDNHPLAVGVVGSNGGTEETRKIVSEADVVMFIGCRAGSVTTERWRFPARGKARIIHLDVDPAVVGANYRADVTLVGDARLGLRSLLAALGHHSRKNDEALARIGEAKMTKFEAFRRLATSNETPIRPERIIAELQSVLSEDAVIVADPGTPCPYFSAYYESGRAGRNFISNRAHGALGYSMAAAMGAQYGRPGVKCVSVMGDGSFGFTCGELETVVRQKLPITFVVISNSVYGWIKAGQKTGFDRRYFSVDFDRTDHAKVAEAFGVKSWKVEDPSLLRQTLGAAVEHGGPTLVDVITQPLHEAHAPVSEWVA